MQLRIQAQSAPWRESILFLIQSKDGKYVSAPLTLKSKPEEVIAAEPTFELSNDEAQALMDDLWHAGLRPSEGTGSAGAMAATQKHLEDMRTLVFGKTT